MARLATTEILTASSRFAGNFYLPLKPKLIFMVLIEAKIPFESVADTRAFIGLSTMPTD